MPFRVINQRESSRSTKWQRHHRCMSSGYIFTGRRIGRRLSDRGEDRSLSLRGSEIKSANWSANETTKATCYSFVAAWFALSR